MLLGHSGILVPKQVRTLLWQYTKELLLKAATWTIQHYYSRPTNLVLCQCIIWGILRSLLLDVSTVKHSHCGEEGPDLSQGDGRSPGGRALVGDSAWEFTPFSAHKPWCWYSDKEQIWCETDTQCAKDQHNLRWLDSATSCGVQGH